MQHVVNVADGAPGPAGIVTGSVPWRTEEFSKRILIAEDDVALRRFVRAAAEEGGFSVDEAACLDDATAGIETVPYDAVVLDLGLP